MKDWKNFLISSLIVVVLVAAVGLGVGLSYLLESEPEPVVAEEPKPEPVSISLMAVGDNLIHGPIYRQAEERAGGSGFDFTMAYEQVVPYVQAADIALINQETPLGGTALGLSSYPCFNSPQELGDYLIASGFDVFSHANNHILDKGSKGFEATNEYWRQQDGVLMVGVASDQFSADQIRMIQKDGVKIAFLAYTYGTNGISLPSSSPGVVNMLEPEKMVADVKKAESVADITVLMVHWGVEYQHHANASQQELAQKLAAAGADIIIGSHPHVVQGVDTLSQPDGSQTVVFYSLGNFISAQKRADTMIEGLAEIDLTYDFSTQKISFDRVQFVPLINQFDAGFKNIRVIPFPEYTQELAQKHGVRQHDSSFSYQYIEDYLNQVVPAQYLNPPLDDTDSAVAEPAV